MIEKKQFIELANKVYRQTLLFPKKEPLRYKTREAADNILSNLIEWEALNSPNPGSFSASGIVQKKDLLFEMEKEIELIKAYFNIVKWQNWVSYFDIVKIEEEYDKISNYFKGIIRNLETEKPAIKAESAKTKKTAAPKVSLDKRKQKILNILKKKEKVQVWEISEILKDVTKRTIRRDFDALLEMDLVKRIGESNNTFYMLS